MLTKFQFNALILAVPVTLLIAYKSGFFSTPEVCPISLEPIVDLAVTNCQHKFEKQNLLEWLKDKSACPCCRVNIVTINDLPVPPRPRPISPPLDEPFNNGFSSADNFFAGAGRRFIFDLLERSRLSDRATVIQPSNLIIIQFRSGRRDNPEEEFIGTAASSRATNTTG